MNRAEFQLSENAFDRCISLSAGVPLGGCIGRHGEDPLIVANMYKGLMLCALGLADRGKESSRLACDLARKIHHPDSVAFASSALAFVYMFRRDYTSCGKLADEQIAHCKEHGFAFWIAPFEIFRGVASVSMNKGGDGLARAEAGISNWMKSNSMLHVPTFCSFVADAAIISGAVTLAERYLPMGIEVAAKNGENLVIADLHRLRGRLLLTQDRREQAREAFETAVATARRKGARLFLLRAARDLARLLAQDGERDFARNLLEPIVREFREHRTGLDFLEAAELLSQLN